MPEPIGLQARPEDPRQHDPLSDPAMVAEVVRSVLSSMRGDLSEREALLFHEVEELGAMIANARHEIAALKVDDITGTHIPSATDELDAIVAHTAVATEAILESCETLDNLCDKIDGEIAATLRHATTRIFEACGFQDITGQRITKVVSTLKQIDAKVSQLVISFGRGNQAKSATTEAAPAAVALENGPQLPANAMDQSGIDLLLAGLD